MDAVMVVHQLQRLAASPNPSPAVAAKLPRVAVGICYFIEHPEVGVRQQAANAVHRVVSLHAELLRNTQEGRELEAMLERHAESSKDPLIVESCQATLAIFRAGRSPSGGAAAPGNPLRSDGAATAEAAACSRADERGRSWAPLSESCPRKEGDSVMMRRGTSGPADPHAGHSGVDREEKKSAANRLGEAKEGAMSPLAASDPRRGGSPLPPPSLHAGASLQATHGPLEGEMCTVLLGLRGLAAEVRRLEGNVSLSSGVLPPAASAPPSSATPFGLQKSLFTKLDALQREIQYRLVRVPGVSSATITLNTRGLCAQLETEDLDHRPARGDGEEGDGIAVLLVRLAHDPKKRNHHLQQIRLAAGPRTLVLRAERVYDGVRRGAGGDRKRRDRRGGERSGDRDTQPRAQAHHEEAEAGLDADGGGSPPVAKGPAYLDDEAVVRGDRNDLGGLGEDESCGRAGAGEGLHGSGETAAGYSFFSRSSVLFSQSRFLGSSILPYEDDPELASRLKREKQKKVEERVKLLESQTVLDRVLGNIGKVRFW
ncbi:hypothetical protein BESB_048460 [Besnoitia besnoiti]|uniref:Uncharacterized protein n=1 Tax=Besnoitia besnoiti TaxID=94643 RepID=A0A2A9MHK5_BESBE|nr:hypothetical protein BESB_048460 [Besnoitia besnoiti]PFH36654.1 hypothetical protein BESB_048460 [Besnoitia besnoiti]